MKQTLNKTTFLRSVFILSLGMFFALIFLFGDTTSVKATVYYWDDSVSNPSFQEGTISTLSGQVTMQMDEGYGWQDNGCQNNGTWYYHIPLELRNASWRLNTGASGSVSYSVIQQGRMVCENDPSFLPYIYSMSFSIPVGSLPPGDYQIEILGLASNEKDGIYDNFSVFPFNLRFTVTSGSPPPPPPPPPSCAAVKVNSNITINWELSGPNFYTAQNTYSYEANNTDTGSYNIYNYPSTVNVGGTTYNLSSGPATPQTCNGGQQISFNFTYASAGGTPPPPPVGPSPSPTPTPTPTPTPLPPPPPPSGCELGAQFINQTIDGTPYNTSNTTVNLAANSTHTVSITMRNSCATGSAWFLGHPWQFRLGSQNPPNNTNWGTSRQEFPSGAFVNPGNNVTFTFNITMPASGSRNLQWQMVADGYTGYFGDMTPNLVLAVPEPPALVNINAERVSDGTITDYTLNITEGEAVNIRWFPVYNPNTCTASGNPLWTGNKNPSGGLQTISSLTAGTYVFSINCFNSSGSGGGDSVTVQVTAPNYTLTVTKSGTGSGTVSSSPAGINSCSTSCSASFAGGTSVTLTPTNGLNSVFTGWSGACSGTGNCVVAVDSNKSVTATFTALGTVTVQTSPSGFLGRWQITGPNGTTAEVGRSSATYTGQVGTYTIVANSYDVAYYNATVNPPSRTLTINNPGESITFTITYTPQVGTVNATSNPTGGSWEVLNSSGTVVESGSSPKTFTLTVGNYQFRVGSLQYYVIEGVQHNGVFIPASSLTNGTTRAFSVTDGSTTDLVARFYQPPPTQPSDINKVLSLCRTLGISWVDRSNNENGFEIYYSTTANDPNPTRVNAVASSAATRTSTGGTITYTWTTSNTPPVPIDQPVYISIRSYIDYGPTRIFSPYTYASTSFTATDCFGDLSSSSKTIHLVNGNSYDARISGKDGDILTFRIYIQNDGTDRVSITSIMDRLHPNMPDDNRDIQLVMPSNGWGARISKNNGNSWQNISNTYSEPQMVFPVSGVKCTTTNNTGCDNSVDPSCTLGSFPRCDSWVLEFRAQIKVSVPDVRTEVWNQADIWYRYSGIDRSITEYSPRYLINAGAPKVPDFREVSPGGR